jgi:glycosyltransferase involved in cell wall biosynthesis
MRLAMLAPRLSTQGPLPKHTPPLLSGLRRLGCEVALLPWGRYQENEHVATKVMMRARDVLHARRAIVRGGFEVVVVKTAHDWRTLSRDLVLLHSVPRDRVVVLQFHGSQSPRLVSPGSWLFKCATAALIWRSDGLLVLSKGERAEWQRFSPRKPVLVVRNVRPTPPRQLDGGEVAAGTRMTILSVSRLIDGKGVDDLIRALPDVLGAHKCRLRIVGDGPEAGRLARLADELSVRDHVDFAGYVTGEALASIYRTADVFALPTSLPEGFPTVILEAMAAGLPIVTTAARGPADHLVEGRNALFVPPHDPPALASALSRLLADDGLRHVMGSSNREKVQDFDAGPVAAEYLAALEVICLAARDRGESGGRRLAVHR